jgi:hypothetical protein
MTKLALALRPRLTQSELRRRESALSILFSATRLWRSLASIRRAKAALKVAPGRIA